jgi:hypothetical protein
MVSLSPFPVPLSLPGDTSCLGHLVSRGLQSNIYFITSSEVLKRLATKPEISNCTAGRLLCSVIILIPLTTVISLFANTSLLFEARSYFIMYVLIMCLVFVTGEADSRSSEACTCVCVWGICVFACNSSLFMPFIWFSNANGQLSVMQHRHLNYGFQ